METVSEQRPRSDGQPRATARRGGKLFVRNTVASIFTFGIDITLLWLLVERAGLEQIIAATLAFFVAISLHYLLARSWVFRGTERGLASGYLYFLINAGVGLIVTLGLFWMLLELTPLHYLISRGISSVAAGIVVFLLNATLNFKRL